MANTKLYHCIPVGTEIESLELQRNCHSTIPALSSCTQHKPSISFVGQLSSVTQIFNGNYPTALESPISCDPYCSLAPPSHFHATALQVFVRNKYRSWLYSFRSLVDIMPIKLELHGKQLPASAAISCHRLASLDLACIILCVLYRETVSYGSWEAGNLFSGNFSLDSIFKWISIFKCWALLKRR